MYNGIINVYKEKGYTSHDVVAKLRGILKQKKIGHTGTLDPDAEGVLPVCLGTGTRLCDMLTERDKTYEAVLLLGINTDTQDISGRVLEIKPVDITEEEVIKAAESFVGSYSQVPPMFSALKVNGKKLYELAREGKEVERKAREVKIHTLEILEIDLPRVRMRVECSKGTYIRTLCYDIGEKLFVGGCMESLLRTKAAGFTLEESHKLSEIENYRDRGAIADILYPVEKALSRYVPIQISQAYTKQIYNGNPFSANEILDGHPADLKQPVRVYDYQGNFIGLYRYKPDKKAFYPYKMFLSE